MNVRRHPFTLIEMLAVVAIIAILAGLIVGGAKFAFDKSQESAIEMRMKTLEMALDEYKKDWGYYPIMKTEGDFKTRFLAPPGDKNNNLKWDSGEGAPYIETYTDFTESYKQSKGGVAFRYQYPGSHNTKKYDLQAYGLDEESDTTDDIKNWTQQ